MHKASIPAICCLLLLSAYSAHAAQAASSDQTHAAAVDALFNKLTDAKSPGVAVGVYRAGQTIYEHGYGLANLEYGAPVTPRTVFNLASVSKQFIGFAVALLARDGKVDLQADIRTYLPWLPDFGKRITVEQLLHHTSGLREYIVLADIGGQDGQSLMRQQHVINVLSRQRALNFEPGSRFEYSNSGYSLLAEIIQKASGKSAAEFLNERVFRPLGMTHTRLRENLGEVIPDAAQGYEEGNDGKTWIRAVYNRETYGPGNIMSTVQDLAKWGANFGAPKVGDRALIEQISSPGRLNDGAQLNYGYGLRHQTLGGQQAITHHGSVPGFRTAFAFFPATGISIAVLANQEMDAEEIIDQVAAIYPSARGKAKVVKEPALIQPTPAQVQALVGNYDGENYRTMVLEMRDGRLIRRDASRVWGPVKFWADGTIGTSSYFGDRFRPVRSTDGAVGALEFIHTYESFSGNEQNERFARVQAVKPSDADMKLLAGEYYSAELDRSFRLSVQSGRLVLTSMWLMGPQTLVPTFRDHFDATEDGPLSSLNLSVRRDAQGKPAGIYFNRWGVYNLALSRMP